ncbi:hypothetical protein OHW85_22560, partial [Acinetobacter baumannii]|nr:hypothetical protein [Acinetobacter baumannii]
PLEYRYLSILLNNNSVYIDYLKVLNFEPIHIDLLGNSLNLYDERAELESLENIKIYIPKELISVDFITAIIDEVEQYTTNELYFIEDSNFYKLLKEHKSKGTIVISFNLKKNSKDYFLLSLLDLLKLVANGDLELSLLSRKRMLKGYQFNIVGE